jgi:hypothetical protein
MGVRNEIENMKTIPNDNLKRFGTAADTTPLLDLFEKADIVSTADGSVAAMLQEHRKRLKPKGKCTIEGTVKYLALFMAEVKSLKLKAKYKRLTVVINGKRTDESSDEACNGTYYDVCGYNPDDTEIEVNEYEETCGGFTGLYGLDGNLWNEWVTWLVANITIEEFGLNRTVTEIIWEMTFWGDTARKVARHVRSLNKLISKEREDFSSDEEYRAYWNGLEEKAAERQAKALAAAKKDKSPLYEGDIIEKEGVKYYYCPDLGDYFNAEERTFAVDADEWNRRNEMLSEWQAAAGKKNKQKSEK